MPGPPTDLHRYETKTTLLLIREHHAGIQGPAATTKIPSRCLAQRRQGEEKQQPPSPHPKRHIAPPTASFPPTLPPHPPHFHRSVHDHARTLRITQNMHRHPCRCPPYLNIEVASRDDPKPTPYGGVTPSNVNQSRTRQESRKRGRERCSKIGRRSPHAVTSHVMVGRHTPLRRGLDHPKKNSIGKGIRGNRSKTNTAKKCLK